MFFIGEQEKQSHGIFGGKPYYGGIEQEAIKVEQVAEEYYAAEEQMVEEIMEEYEYEAAEQTVEEVEEIIEETIPSPQIVIEQEIITHRGVSFSDQGLTKISESDLRRYRKAKLLNLSDNKLTELPSFIGKMKYLEVLILNNNQLAELPYFLQNCKRLQRIEVNNNPIEKIRCNLKNMPKVNHIELENTAFNSLPRFPDRMDLSVILTIKDYENAKEDVLYDYTYKRYKYTIFEFL